MSTFFYVCLNTIHYLKYIFPFLCNIWQNENIKPMKSYKKLSNHSSLENDPFDNQTFYSLIYYDFASLLGMHSLSFEFLGFFVEKVFKDMKNLCKCKELFYVFIIPKSEISI